MKLAPSRHGLSLLTALMLSACSPDPTAEGSAEGPIGSDLSVAESPLVKYELDQGSLGFDLSTYTAARLLSDGRLAVLCCDNRVLFFTADGKYTASVGSRGEGPDQFRAARMTLLPGDTILVYDATSRRASWIHPVSGIARTLELGTGVPLHYSTPLGVDADGAVLLTSLHSYSEARLPRADDSLRTMAEVVVAGPGQAPKVLFALGDLLLVARTPPNGPSTPKLMDNVRYGGAAQVVVGDDVLYAMPGGSRRLEVYGFDGAALRASELALPRTAVTETDRTAFIEMETAPLRDNNLGGHAPPPNLRATLEFLTTAVFADSFPPAEHLLRDVSGEDLWIVQGSALGAARWYATRVSPAGEITATVGAEIPGFRPLAFMGMSVLLERSDADGVTWFELRAIAPRVYPPEPAAP